MTAITTRPAPRHRREVPFLDIITASLTRSERRPARHCKRPRHAAPVR